MAYNRNDFCTIYLITNNINGLVYVGQTWISYKRRFTNHCNGKLQIDKAIREFGRENFSVFALASAKTQYDADFLETHLIARFDSRNQAIGYNRTTGGSYGLHREDTKQLLSRIAKATRGVPTSIETAIVNAYLRGDPYKLIISSFDISSTTIVDIINRNSLPFRKPEVSVDKETLIVEAYMAGVRPVDIAKQYVIGPATVNAIARKNNLPLQRTPITPQVEQLVISAYTADTPIKNITAALDVGETSIRTIINRSKTPKRDVTDVIRRVGKANKGKTYRKRMTNELAKQIAEAYIEGQSYATIMETFDVGETAIIRIRKKYNLLSRTMNKTMKA